MAARAGKYVVPGTMNRTIGRFVSGILRVPFLRYPYLFAKDCKLLPKSSRNMLGMGINRALTYNPKLRKTLRTGKALIMYYSRTGNTRKVALSIERGVRKGGLDPTIKTVSDSLQEDYYDYDLVCLGTPVLHALPPHPVMRLVRKNFVEYRKRYEVWVPQRRIPGKYALVFVTFSGPHIGIDEALPAGKYLVQEFKHLGFDVRGEWYIVGEFHGWETGSTKGKMGDIRGRPNAEDLARVEERIINLVESIRNSGKTSSEVFWALT